MFIDIHAHVCKYDGFFIGKEKYFYRPDELLRRHDAVGIEKAILLPMVHVECTYQTQSNEEVLAICREYPGRFVPFCNIDPRGMTNSVDAPLGDFLRYYRDQGCKGVGEICANLPFLHPLVQNLFKHTEETGIPLTFHVAAQIVGLYGLYDEPGLPQLERSLQKFPKLKYFAHSQTFWAEMAVLETPGDRYGYPKYPIRQEGVVPKLMRRYQNLYGDLSAGSGFNALNRDPAYAAGFLDEFQDRLLFGTDICAPSTTTPLVDFMLNLRKEQKISETVFQKVARDNARRILGIE